MRRSILFIFVTAFILMLSCSSMSVHTDFDDQADFALYKTYNWMAKKEKPAGRAELADTRIKRAVDNELDLKGYHRAGKGNKPDLLIIYHMNVTQKIQVDHYGYRYWGPRHTEVTRYKEGTLVLDFIDAKNQQLVWRGWASGILGKPDKMEEHINKAVSKLMEKYPPQ